MSISTIYLKIIEIDNGIRFLNNYRTFVNFFMNEKEV